MIYLRFALKQIRLNVDEYIFPFEVFMVAEEGLEPPTQGL